MTGVDRYLRLRQAGWNPEQLALRTTLVCGCGALGSEVARHLAGAGVGKIVLLDRDAIELHNLTGSFLLGAAADQVVGLPKAEVAASQLRRINPQVTTTAMVCDLFRVGLGHFRAADLVLGCVDSVEARLEINRRCWALGRPWLDGGLGIDLGAVAWYRPEEQECYECTLSPGQWDDVRTQYDCAGLRRRVPARALPALPTVAAVIAAVMAQRAIEFLQGERKPTPRKLFYLPGPSQLRAVDEYGPQSPDCVSHRWRIQPLDSPLTAQSTLAEVAESYPGAVLRLRDPLLTQASCSICGLERRLDRPAREVHADEVECCQGAMRLDLVECLEVAGDPRTLADVGVPSGDVIELDGPLGVRWLVLTG